MDHKTQHETDQAAQSSLKQWAEERKVMREHRRRQQEQPEAVAKEFAERLNQQMRKPQKSPFFPHCLPQFPNELFADWVKDKAK